MMRTITSFLGVGVVFLACSMAHAGMVSFSCHFPEDPYGYYHYWDYDFANKRLTVTENLFAIPPAEGDQVVMSGETDGSTTFTVVKTITNTTGTTWMGYDLELLSTGTFVDGTAGSTKFGTHAFSNDFKILHFYAPQSVLNTEVVTLQVDITVPTTGLFEFTMAQHPTPEPATLLLFGLGAMMLRKRKKLK